MEHFLLRADGVLVSRVDTRVYRAGDPVSCIGTLGYEYAKVDFNGRRIYPLVHRIVIALVSGRWPEELVDHINGVRNDNRPENLREVNRFENARNTPRTRARTL